MLWTIKLYPHLSEGIHIGIKLGPKLMTKICINNEGKVSKFRWDVHRANEIKWYEISFQTLLLTKCGQECNYALIFRKNKI